MSKLWCQQIILDKDAMQWKTANVLHLGLGRNSCNQDCIRLVGDNLSWRVETGPCESCSLFPDPVHSWKHSRCQLTYFNRI